MLSEKKFDEIVKATPNTVEKLMQLPQVTLRSLAATAGERPLKFFLEVEVAKLASRMNIANNITSSQIPFIVETLIETYPLETLNDFILCFKRLAIGYYGNSYHKLDAATICEAMAKHIDEKCTYLERGVSDQKKEEESLKVDYELFKKRLEDERSKEKESEKKKKIEMLALAQNKDWKNIRKNYKVKIEDHEGKFIGEIESVLALSQAHADQIVLKMIDQGEIYFNKNGINFK